jgi:hypothetical protein
VTGAKPALGNHKKLAMTNSISLNTDKLKNCYQEVIHIREAPVARDTTLVILRNFVVYSSPTSKALDLTTFPFIFFSYT